MLINGKSIRKTDNFRHKYDGPIAELLDDVGFPDDEVGTVDSFGNYRRWGRRILKTDGHGFVETIKFPSERDGARFMSELRNVADHIDDADRLYDYRFHDTLQDRLEYVLQCALLGLIPTGTARWVNLGKPTSPFGDEEVRCRRRR